MPFIKIRVLSCSSFQSLRIKVQTFSFKFSGGRFVTLSDKKQHVIPACFLAGIQEITKTAIKVMLFLCCHNLALNRCHSLFFTPSIYRFVVNVLNLCTISPNPADIKKRRPFREINYCRLNFQYTFDIMDEKWDFLYT